MRVLLGWLLLFGLAGLAGWGTARWRSLAHARGDSATRAPDASAPGIPAIVVIGAHDGVGPALLSSPPPVAGPLVTASPPALQAPRPGEGTRAPRTEVSPRPAQTFRLTIRPGQSLSKICQDFYKSPGRPRLKEVVDAVARWNDLPTPDALRVDQVLELPALEVLFPG